MTSAWPAIRAQLNGQVYRPAGFFYAVEGTAYPGCPFPPQPIIDDGTGWWAGFASGMVGGLTNLADGLWQSRCIGYSAATLPMWPSVQEGRQRLCEAIARDAAAYHSTHGSYDGLAIAGAGYSQGAMVWGQVWVHDILDPAGVLHELLPYVYRIYTFGDPFRCPGIAHGNALAGLSESIFQDGVETGGIGLGLDLTPAQTNHAAPDGRPVVHACANPGDLYSACSTGSDPWNSPADEGSVGFIFFNIVMQPTFEDVIAVAGVLNVLMAAVMELFHTMVFFAQGQQSPHYLYFPQMNACIDDAHRLGLSLPNAGVL